MKKTQKFVENAHFGGGLLRNTESEGAKTHKDLIDQLIAESAKVKRPEEDTTKKTKIDDYDKVMRELKFEARGTVSDRLKTEDEIAKDEKEKLEQLEKERLERMKGYVDLKAVKAHTQKC
ncbi:hypothetical protein NQ318_011522 [Aromia moschata]|uniref:Uncharacterized protein n=1 Tax=Aromia moschata TaxID=1265417 RepID=A0AAV8XSK5_9CUCU|nr:hypothetical protein NQ318_011522 [Aromia moschata]